MPIPVALAGGLISGAGSLIGGGLNMLSRKWADKRAVKFWNLQNEYNHPARQMERLREAGLNPALMYGQSASGATGTAGAIDIPQREQFDNPLNNITKFADVEVKKAQSDNLQQLVTNNQLEGAFKTLKVANQQIKNSSDSLEFGIAKELRQTSIDAQNEALKSLRAQTYGRQIDNLIKDSSAAAVIKEAFQRAILMSEQVKGQQLLNELRALERDLNAAGIQKNDAMIFRGLLRMYNKGVFDDVLQFLPKFND